MLLLSVNRKEISSNLRLHLSNKQWLGFQGSSNFLYYIFPGNITVVSTLFQDYFLLDKVFEKQRSQILKKIKNIFLNIEYNYSIKLKVIGVGYKIDPMPSQKILNLKLGFSHEIQFPLESGIFCKRLNDRSSIYIFSSNDSQTLKNFLARLKKYRPVEPYKGKGLRYLTETIKRKEGKKSNL